MEFHSEFHSVLWNFSTHSTLFPHPSLWHDFSFCCLCPWFLVFYEFFSLLARILYLIKRETEINNNTKNKGL